MASPFFLVAAVSLAVAALLSSPAASQSCKSHTFSNRNASFANCEDLPSLKASLHWTFDPSARPNPTLTIAFVAPPARPDGWIAWALNPTAPGMVGSQALIAFRSTNGSIVVNTYNISSYSSVTESRIAYDVLDKRAEASNGTMSIFATLSLPSPAASQLNQVWQVGPSVRNGAPTKHDFSPENLRSTGTLRLGGAATNGRNGMAPSPAPASGGGPTGTRGGGESGGSWRVCGSYIWVYGVLVLIGAFWEF